MVERDISSSPIDPRAQPAEADRLDGCRDRHLDAVAVGQIEHRAARLHAFGDLAVGGVLGLLERLAAAEPLAERPVARQRRGAGRHQVTEPGQPGERQRVGAELGTQPGRLGQPAGDQRRDGVVAEAHALRDAARQRDHVLDRAAELAADHVGVGVRTEVRRRAGLLHDLGALLVDARDDGGGRLLLRDLEGEVRPGHHRDPLRRARRRPRR